MGNEYRPKLCQGGCGRIARAKGLCRACLSKLDGPPAPRYPRQPGVIPPCSAVDPEVFFPQDIRMSGREAKRICSDCPLRIACLEWAIYHRETGIWGGTNDNDRDEIRRARRRRKVA